jgi:hypothetical protein
MGSWNLSIPLTLLYLFGVRSAIAQDGQNCDNALVRATYNNTSSRFLDYRLADYVDENTYNSLTTGIAASTVIYGVPVGADYKSFKQDVQRRVHSHDESLSIDELRNVAWTGLDERSNTPYIACVNAQNKNLRLIPVKATTHDIRFEVRYAPVGASPIPLPVTWQGNIVTQEKLPSEIPAGGFTIVVQRPKPDDGESSLAVNGAGFTDSVTLTPLPPVLPTPSPTPNTLCLRLAPVTEIGRRSSFGDQRAKFVTVYLTGASIMVTFKLSPRLVHAGRRQTSSRWYFMVRSANPAPGVLPLGRRMKTPWRSGQTVSAFVEAKETVGDIPFCGDRKARHVPACLGEHTIRVMRAVQIVIRSTSSRVISSPVRS